MIATTVNSSTNPTPKDFVAAHTYAPSWLYCRGRICANKLPCTRNQRSAPGSTARSNTQQLISTWANSTALEAPPVQYPTSIRQRGCRRTNFHESRFHVTKDKCVTVLLDKNKHRKLGTLNRHRKIFRDKRNCIIVQNKYTEVTQVHCIAYEALQRTHGTIIHMNTNCKNINSVFHITQHNPVHYISQ